MKGGIKMKKYFALLLILVLTVSFTSAFWPFSAKITGNVVDESQMTDTDKCKDYDSGIYTLKPGFVLSKSGNWFSQKTKTNVDSCLGSKKNILDSDGKKIGTGMTKIKEYYCEDDTLKEYIADSSLLGEGYCINEKITVEGKTISAAKWVKTSSVCIEIEGGVKDGFSNVYKDYCDDKDFVDYSCKEGKIVNTTNTCPGKCSLTSGCNSFCDASTDNDATQDPAVFGSVYFENTQINDTCTEKENSILVKQSYCSNEFSIKEDLTTFKDSCDGNNFVDYSCDSGALKKEITPCEGSCSLTKGGCYGFCNASADNDPNQIASIGGSVNSGGKIYTDTCGKNDDGKIFVKQYFCETSSILSSNKTYCSRDQECLKDTNGQGYCVDKISTTQTVTTIEEKIANLQGKVATLEQQVTGLLSHVDSLNRTVMSLNIRVATLENPN